MIDAPSAANIMGATPSAAPAPAAPAFTPAAERPRQAGWKGTVDPRSLFAPGQPIPPHGTAEYANASMTAGRVELGLITREAAMAELAGTAGAPADATTGTTTTDDPDTGNEPAVAADPIKAMAASRELSAGLQEAGDIAGLDKGSAEFYAKHLGEALQRPPVTQAASDQAASETMQMLNQAYGSGKAAQMVQDARAELAELSKRIPQLPNWLGHTGAGNDAGIILRLAARHAERARARIVAQVRR